MRAIADTEATFAARVAHRQACLLGYTDPGMISRTAYAYAKRSTMSPITYGALTRQWNTATGAQSFQEWSE
jgi:hypothetical protein